MTKLSIIIPCYNEEESLPLFYRETTEVLQQIPDVEMELLFVNDGSSDRTHDILQSLADADEHCHYITFSRNFGKEAAMFAGLENATGDLCVIMDADLQHPPALLPQMYQVLTEEEQYDCCGGFRLNRKGEGTIRNLLSKTFYKILKKACKLNMDNGAGDFRMMRRKMVDSILACKEYNRYLKGIFSFVGFETKWIPFENTERAAGTTKWSFRSLFRYALDGIFSFSTVPITLAGTAGAFLFFLASLMGMYIAVNTIFFGNDVSGWTTIVCLILFLNGIQLLFISILGQYISKNYMESKGRPIYIIKEQH